MRRAPDPSHEASFPWSCRRSAARRGGTSLLRDPDPDPDPDLDLDRVLDLDLDLDLDPDRDPGSSLLPPFSLRFATR